MSGPAVGQLQHAVPFVNDTLAEHQQKRGGSSVEQQQQHHQHHHHHHHHHHQTDASHSQRHMAIFNG
ncbi:GH19386 [Drosophila grimshawi]|uniref:GH19386 n=1 Tax=Drosophila grimshawi TaxID=7222 RepID=B4JFT0_DROGR|nr:GH19386 [Drosophila grimshawi]